MRSLLDRNTFSIRRSTALMIGGTAAIICACVGALLWTLGIAASSVDSTAEFGERRLVATVVDTYQTELSKTVIDYTTWDEMFNNFAKGRSPDWERGNLGPSITSQLGIDYVAVTTKDGEVVYLFSKKSRNEMSASPGDLARLSAITKLAFRRTPGQGTPVEGAMMFDGTPGLVAAAPINSSRGEQAGFALIEIRALDKLFLSQMSKGFGLTGVHVIRWNGTGLPLAAAQGDAPELAMEWTPSNAGRQLFTKIMPAAVLTGVMLVIMFSALLVVWRRIVEQMRTSEARVLTAELDAARARATVAEETAQSKNAFIANMNHELRTPLNAIIGFSEIIQSEAFGAIGVPKYREYIHDINESGNHLLGIINDILLVSRVDAGKFVPNLQAVSFQEVLGDVVRMMEVIAAKRAVWMNTTHCDMGVAVFADPQALRQVLLNVLSNAVKFSPEGYGIDIEGGEKVDGTYELRIIDYGCGIPPETLQDIGKPFVQAETAYTRNYQGTGLGLSICYRLMAAMNGSIDIQSTVKVGTTVSLILKTSKCAQLDHPHSEVA